MRKHRWFALLLAGMMAVLVAVPGWNLAAAKAEATAELPVWQQPFEETVTLDVVIGWDATRPSRRVPPPRPMPCGPWPRTCSTSN